MANENALHPNGSAIILHPDDNVATALRDLGCGTKLTLPNGREVYTIEPIPFGYKVAICTIELDEYAVKYGVPIGVATQCIVLGAKVHTHNLVTLQAGSLT